MLLVFTLSASSSLAEEESGTDASSQIPAQVDPAGRYLFYLHGAWIERYGVDHPHPRHGPYQYAEIVQALTNRGFVVISEARRGEINVSAYAKKVTAQVRRLLEAGVSPSHVSVIGHSKGGQIALLTASELHQEGLNFVIMAGCGSPGSGFGRSYESFLETRAARLRGRMLSLYDASDRVAGSCRRAFDRAPDLKSEERVLETGRGHALFYTPSSIWVDEVVAWSQPKS
jgi:pimeloyl-ACP methyl ester carboxylesterase